MPHDSLTEIITSLGELKRLHQLNLELLEQLSVACGFLTENKVPIPNEGTFVSLLKKATTLLSEIYSEPSSTMLVVTKPADETLQRKRTDEDLTEPAKCQCGPTPYRFLHSISIRLQI